VAEKGQGNGVGPQIWVAVCTPLFAIILMEGFIATNYFAMSKVTTELVGLAFVDDTDLLTNDASNEVEQVRKCNGHY